MATLYGAIALAERHDVAVGQAEQLYLDVASSGHVPLQQDRGVAEESLRAGAGGVERGAQPHRIGRYRHADAAAAG